MNASLDGTSSDNWPPRAAQQERLNQLETLLAKTPDSIDVQIERAALLSALDRRVEAQQAFVAVLLRAPDNFSALNKFGNLLASMGLVAAACRIYSEAIKHHPQKTMAHVNLANLMLRGGEYKKARQHYEAALALDPQHPQAHQGLGAVLAAIGERNEAKAHLQAGFAGHFMATLPYRGTRPPVRVLLLVSSGDGNIPTASFLDDRIFLVTVIVSDFIDPSVALPPHRLIFNAVGDADQCKPALEAARRLLRRSGAPVINDPAAVLKTGRAENAERLGRLDGVRTPRMLTLPRALLVGEQAAAVLDGQGFTFPLLLRTPGFHTGRNFILINEAQELPKAADSLPGEELLAIEYLDARGGDGKVRKCRAMIVDGKIYPMHLATSQQWKVHYFTADMADDLDHRAHDAAFLEDMVAVIGNKAMGALERIRAVLGLDYGGIDFGLSPAGEVLLFEANATMVVNPPEADARWAYRRAGVTRILNAVNAMIVRRAAGYSLQKVG
jgi:glutathione synthase/RimK-type ligase-like ATP-grasp enzyme/Flp pilus assembly protein TadD